MDNSRITLRALKAFQAAADTGSFTRAAEQMYMTQPAFSRMISALEDEMGVRLFSRTTRKVTLTPEGQLCYRRVVRMLDSFDALERDLASSRRDLEGILRVGFNPLSGPPEFLIRGLKALGSEYPKIKVTLSRNYSYDLIKRVRDGELDCALVSEFYITPEDDLTTKPLQPIRTYTLLHTSHPLAQKETVHISDLEGIPLIFMKDSAPLTRQSTARHFEEKGIPLTEDFPAEDLEDMVFRVRLGTAVGITSFNDPNHRYEDIVPILVSEFNRKKGYRVLAWRREDKNPILQIFYSILERQLRPEAVQ